MPIASRFRQSLRIERPTSGSLDAYHQPTRTYSTLATVPGLIQPLSAKEIALLSQAGPVVSQHRGYITPRDITTADRIVADDRTYEITGIADAGGVGHHLELALTLIEAPA